MRPGLAPTRRRVIRKPSARLAPRERILAAARELFYRDGIRAVGVEAIAACAGTNKMTLYRHFSSKDALISAYLNRLSDESDAVWEEARRAEPGNPGAQLRWLLRRVSQFADESSGRGCALANAAVELAGRRHPACRIVEAQKRRTRERLVALCREAGFAHPRELADELFLLVEGARVSLQSVGPRGPGSRLCALAEALLDAAPKVNHKV
ncbi:MAG: TetR/AcrR family transcriptional regulator [Betaproteobacteria bacterium]|nr:TetR/AcrR family transcriptional regulator [Betaproteobacteria bacterium]